MKNSHILRVAAAIGVAAASLGQSPAMAKDYLGAGYPVTLIRPGGDRPCTLFQLAGITEADPVLPGSPWFVIENTAPEYKTMVATLLTAKATGRNLQVSTAGTVSATCGHPVVSVIILP